MSSLDAAAGARGGRRRRRRRWREGGSSTARWDAELLGWAVCAVGAGALAAHIAPLVFPVETEAAAASALVWLALAAPIVLGFSRSRPRGLLRFRAIDLVYGFVFGVLLRLAQGVAADVWEEGAAWPSTFSTDGGLPPGFAVEAASQVIVAPVLEELFFRGVILVGVFSLLRRAVGSVAAGTAAVASSTALFVAAHLMTAARGPSDLVALVLLGVVAGAFTVGTGRIWPAVALHVVFNATGLGLVAVGTLLG